MHLEASHLRFVLGLLALLLTPHLNAAPANYSIDPVHTRVVFAVDHYGFSRALGALSGATGTLQFDPDDWTTASVDVAIPLARLDLGDAKWNQRMLKADFFAADTHPTARFQSTRIEPIDATHATIFGTLSLRGESREVSLQATLNRRARHPLTLRRTLGFSATATLSRAEFGMRSWKSAIGDSVSLIIEVEASRARRVSVDPPSKPAAANAGGSVQ